MRDVFSAEAVIAEVKVSFPLHPIPHNVGKSAYSFEMNAFLNGRSWDKVTIDTILNEGDLKAEHPLFWINDEGFRYYVPAYILMTFSERAKAEIWMLEPFLTQICAYEITSTYLAGMVPTIEPERVARFTGFSAAQKRAIANYLVYQAYDSSGAMAATTLPDMAKLALASYWQPYADTQGVGK